MGRVAQTFFEIWEYPARLVAFQDCMSSYPDLARGGRLTQGLLNGCAASLAAERFECEAVPHMNDIYRTALRVLGDRTRAEDVTQEVYLRAWKSFDRFQPGTNCRAWLYKILFHCVNHHRRKWFRFPLLRPAEEFLEANLAAPAPVPANLSDAEVLAALDGLPQDFRAVVLLVDVEEFPYKEASEILDVPIGTVMSRLHRGRKLLKETLKDVARSYGIGGRE